MEQMTSQAQAESPEAFQLKPANFPGEERIHISVNVADLFESVNFYRHFFGIDPIKIREGYAKFDVQDPPLNFSVNENPLDTRTQGHLGIQVKSTRFVKETYARLPEWNNLSQIGDIARQDQTIRIRPRVRQQGCRGCLESRR